MNSLTYDKILSSLDLLVKKGNENCAERAERIEKYLKDCFFKIKEFEDSAEIIKKNVNTEEIFQKKGKILKEIQKLDDQLMLSAQKFEDLNKNILISPFGTSEREVFIQYLTEKSPKFLKECDVIENN